jgi:1,4-alpha-glucan branching enzyme
MKQSFAFKAPTAQSVLLAGDFTGWMEKAIPLHKEKDGVWRVTTSLAPGTHYYRFVVDGEWCDDPECKLRVLNPFGSQDDVITVREHTNGTSSRGTSATA